MHLALGVEAGEVGNGPWFSCSSFHSLQLPSEKAVPPQMIFTLMVESSSVPEEWSCQAQSSSWSFRGSFSYAGLRPLTTLKIKTKMCTELI